MNAGHTDEQLLVPPVAAILGLRTRALGLAVVGIALSIGGYFYAGPHFWESYLIALFFWNGLTMGSLAVLMVQYLSGGAWGLVARRILEAGTRTLPLTAVLFIPIVLNMQTLYPWARPEAASDPLIQIKAAYLNPQAFVLRSVLYFLILGALTFILNKWSREQDRDPAQLPGPADGRCRVVSGPGICIYVLVVTFMSVDWVMSLDPHWFSTIFGVLTLGGQGLSALAFTLIVVSALIKHKPMSDVVGVEQVHDISKLMFAFVLLWAYFSVSQLIIIWSANLPEEIPFYLERLHGPWYPISVLVVIGHFVLPYLLLLSRDLKRNAQRVKWVALGLLVMRVVDITWTVGPMFRHEGSSISWVDFAVAAGMGGLWLAYFFTNLAARSVVPAKDPYFKEEMAHVGH
jgi:hypothetical protein